MALAQYRGEQEAVIKALQQRAPQGTSIRIVGIEGDDVATSPRMYKTRRLTVAADASQEHVHSGLLMGEKASVSLISSSRDEKAANTKLCAVRDGADVAPSPASGPEEMKAAVVVFPGINRERDMARTLKLVSGREPAMVWHADTALPGRHRSRGDPRRLLLRRLSALRRDRGARADHGRGARARRKRRAGARRLQRLPDPVRGRAAAGRADAQRRT